METSTHMETVLPNVNLSDVERGLRPPTQKDINLAVDKIANAQGNEDKVGRQQDLVSAARTLASHYRVLPPNGLNPNLEVKNADVSFGDQETENGEYPETVTIRPYGSETFSMAVRSVIRDSQKERPVPSLNLALMKEDPNDNIGVRIVKKTVYVGKLQGVASPQGDATVHDSEETILEVYRSGQKTHDVTFDSKGNCKSAFIYHLDENKANNRPSGSAIIPSEVRQKELTWVNIDKDQEINNGQHLYSLENTTGKNERLIKKRYNLKEIDSLAQSIDQQGKPVTTPLRDNLKRILNLDVDKTKV